MTAPSLRHPQRPVVEVADIVRASPVWGSARRPPPPESRGVGRGTWRPGMPIGVGDGPLAEAAVSAGSDDREGFRVEEAPLGTERVHVADFRVGPDTKEAAVARQDAIVEIAPRLAAV